MQEQEDLPSPRVIVAFVFIFTFLVAMAACGVVMAAEPGKSVWQATKCEAYSAVASSCPALRGLVRVKGLAAVKATARKCGATEEQIAARESSCQ